MTSIYEQIQGNSQAQEKRKQHIEEIFARIYQADDTESGASLTKKQSTLELAAAMKAIMLENGQQEFVRTICSTICKQFREDKRSHLVDWTVEILPAEYKSTVEQSSIQSSGIPEDLPVECSIKAKKCIGAVQLLQQVTVDEVGSENMQKIHGALCKAEHMQEEKMDECHIAHHNPYQNKSPTDEINEAADEEYSETISAPSLPIPADELIQQIDDEAFEETIMAADDLRKWADLQRRDRENPDKDKDKGKTPSQTLEQAKRWRDSVKAFRLIIRQFIDGKARRSMNQWGKINAVMAEHGGTAASSKSALPVTDPTTGKQLVDPKTHRLVFRNITKEQIDARGPKYASEIDFIVRQPMLLDMFEERFTQLTNGIREYRAYSARDKLSRQA